MIPRHHGDLSSTDSGRPVIIFFFNGCSLLFILHLVLHETSRIYHQRAIGSK